VSARISGTDVALTLGNDGSGSCHFAVYSYSGSPTTPRHVDSTSRWVVRVPVAELVVQGPNRFWYELSGSAAVDVTFRNGSLELVNYGRSTITLRVHALRYTTRTSTVRLRPGQRRSLNWATDHGWYDLEVTAPDFRRRLTGRAEDGRPGITA
jgi:phospholipase C